LRSIIAILREYPFQPRSYRQTHELKIEIIETNRFLIWCSEAAGSRRLGISPTSTSMADRSIHSTPRSTVASAPLPDDARDLRLYQGRQIRQRAAVGAAAASNGDAMMPVPIATPTTVFA
jgi:hypothetical protein